MSIHVPTIALTAVLVGVELALGFLLIGRMLGRQRGLGVWSVAAILLSVGGLSWGLYGVVPELLVILLGNGMQYVGFGLLWVGCREFCDKRRLLWPVIAGFLPYLGALVFFATVVPSTRARVIVFTLGTAPWTLLSAWTFLRAAPPALRTSARITSAVLFIHGSFLIVRMFLSQPGTSTMDLLRQSWPQALTMFEIYLGSIAALLALVALLTHRLMVDFTQAARIDELTGVLNRRAVEEEGERALALSEAMHLSSAVLLFDLDDFKAVNDTYGHPAGDAVLRHFSKLVGPALRRSDVFGRYGGEEFLAVLPGTGAAAARAVADWLRRRVAENPIVVNGAPIPQTVSIGVSCGEGETLHEMIDRADQALYRAKGMGRNRVEAAA